MFFSPQEFWILTHYKLQGSRSRWLSADAPVVQFVDGQIPKGDNNDFIRTKQLLECTDYKNNMVSLANNNNKHNNNNNNREIVSFVTAA